MKQVWRLVHYVRLFKLYKESLHIIVLIVAKLLIKWIIYNHSLVLIVKQLLFINFKGRT
jgi:hypothetical protein